MASRPMREMLEAASLRTSAHMPGHGGKAPFPLPDFYRLDTTEIPATDDLYAARNGIARAQTLYATAPHRESMSCWKWGCARGIP